MRLGKSVRAAFARIGRKGGRAGRGAAKRRGGPDYYRRIRQGKDKDPESVIVEEAPRLEALAAAPLITIDTLLEMTEPRVSACKCKNKRRNEEKVAQAAKHFCRRAYWLTLTFSSIALV